MSKKTVTWKVKDLKTDIFVRQQLNQDRVVYLLDLHVSGVKLQPIEITADGRIIDGRHRKEMYEVADVTEIECIVRDDLVSEVDIIAAAYKANTGGPLPPNTCDTEHTVTMLLDRGVSKKQIGDLLGLPAGLARKYVNSVQTKMNQMKLQRAATAVTEGGLTVAKAAEVHGVEPDKLKEFLGGVRRKRSSFADIKRKLTIQYKSLASTNAARYKSLLFSFEDGECTEKQVREIFAHIDQLQKKAVRTLADWVKRFNDKVKPVKPAKPAK